MLAAETLSIRCLSTVPYNNQEYQLQILWHGPTASRASRISKQCLLNFPTPFILKKNLAFHKIVTFSSSLSYLNFTAQAFVSQRSIMEQKLLAQTAHINTALQCSAQTTAEPSFNQRHSHRYCHPAAFQQLNTRTLTRLLPPQLRVPQRMYDSLISICLVPFMEARSNTD